MPEPENQTQGATSEAGAQESSPEPVSYSLTEALTERFAARNGTSESSNTANGADTETQTADESGTNDGEPSATAELKPSEDQGQIDATAEASDTTEAVVGDEASTDESDEAKLSRRQQAEAKRNAEIEAAREEGRKEAARAAKAEADLAAVRANQAKVEAEVAEILGTDEEFERLVTTPRRDLAFEDQEKLDGMIDARKRFGVFREQARLNALGGLIQEVLTAAAESPGVDPEFPAKPGSNLTTICKHFYEAGGAQKSAELTAKLTQLEAESKDRITRLEAENRTLKAQLAGSRPSPEVGGRSGTSVPPNSDVFDPSRSFGEQLKEGLVAGRR